MSSPDQVTSHHPLTIDAYVDIWNHASFNVLCFAGYDIPEIGINKITSIVFFLPGIFLLDKIMNLK